MRRCDLCGQDRKDDDVHRLRIWSQWKNAHGIKLGLIGKRRTRYLNVCANCQLNTEQPKQKGSTL